MSVLSNDIFNDPIEMLFDIAVSSYTSASFGSCRLEPIVEHIRKAILDAANDRKEWFAETIYGMKATGNEEFAEWLTNAIKPVFPSWEVAVRPYVCFWYGVPEVPDRMATITIETIGRGVYNLKIFDKRFAHQYKGINPEIYDRFLVSQPTGTNGYDLLNAILNKSPES